MFKFILAAAGFFLLGRHFSGVIIGFVVGSIIDNFITVRARTGEGESIFDYFAEQTVQSNQDFPTALMALSAAVMKADGQAKKAELDFIKSFFTQQFGDKFSVAHLQALKRFVEATNIPLERICAHINQRMQIEVRIHLLHYLFGIARADGHVDAAEINVIKRIAGLLEIPAADFESIKNMFYRDVNSDYHILGIESSATEEEIKKAYRQMAIRYHPDKVIHMGEEYQKGAKEKFQKIQEAYENIKKSRGIA